MRRGELFELPELRIPLSPIQREAALRRIVESARLGARYAYTIKEACGILSVSRDVMDHLIHFYHIDALALEAIYWTLPLLVYRKISTKYNDKERENDKENHQKAFLHGGIQEGSGGIGGKAGEASQPGS